MAYRYGFNGMERDDEVYGNGNFMNFGARGYDARLGRWWGRDIQANKFAFSSPYVYGLDSPIFMKDPNGEHNVVYLVDLRTKEEIELLSAEEIKAQAEVNFQKLELNTTVVIVKQKDIDKFSTEYIDKTDGVAILGELETIKEYAREVLEKSHPDFNLGTKGWTGGAGNPGRTPENEQVSLLTTTGLKSNMSSHNNSPAKDVLAFVINHEFGHVAGITH